MRLNIVLMYVGSLIKTAGYLCTVFPKLVCHESDGIGSVCIK